MDRFGGKIAIVTGASSGIGKATAQRLADEGAAVALVDINAEALKHAIPTSGANHMTFTCDVSDEDAVKACIAQVLDRYGRLDVICNNAGVTCTPAPITEIDTGELNRVFGVNLFATMYFIKHGAPAMIAQGSGAIVNTASVAGIRSGAGGNIYSASKAGVINLTQTTACDLGGHGIRVNAVCPGLIETGMTKPIFDMARSAGKEDRLGARAELRRYGRPEEIASVIAFLASDDASFMTGQALPVDGGNSASLSLPGMKF
ncbi:SDR family NAD(P)-dependent oxidoreductase [Thalassovita taeanensis]|uniref:NAD(P)-dependent dehydrogenase, short-chain alcohol dehydrogenase family n=1 Tax=Thalassovita taeanensis TaxID=657014 RepID=A0A1H9B9M7_9RHOB|nr:SDR family oxidoreductase [Thalassovita taeanensis]SEP84928.1 NAD(P)-dependent dehydrogenase, short-chain alcohol dehydrogenase family [Thalassovita taeanensis]